MNIKNYKGLMASLVGVSLFGADLTSHASGDAVAVFDIDARNVKGLSARQLGNFTNLLDGVVAASGYQTVPRSTLKQQLVEQQSESYKDCYDESCQIELGKAVAAQKAFSSTWANLGGSCVLTVRLFDLRKEVTEFSTQAEAACTQAGLRDAIKNVGLALKARGQSVGTFSLDLKAGSDIKNTPTDETGYLKVNVHPKGRLDEKVEIYINGRLAGTTNRGFFTKELPLGRYVVVMRTAGGLFKHQRSDIQMTAKGVRIPKAGKIELQPMFGYLVVEGAPSDATVVINGEPKPTSGRLRVEKRIGEYSVVVEAAGYLPSKAQKVTVPPGEEARVTYNLIRNAGGLAVTGAPTGAQVKIDGVVAGSLPLNKPELDIGDHIVEVTQTGFHPVKKVISVKRGSTAALDIKLTEKLARLKVESVVNFANEENLIEADIYLDGVKVGATPWKAKVRAEVPHEIVLGLGKARTPATSVTLPEGTERKERIVVPSSWGGAVSNIKFDLVDGPWEIRSGPAVFKTDAPNPVRPGEVPLDFFLSGQKVGTAKVMVSPDETKNIVITRRPRTEAELASQARSQTLRRWLSLGATGLAAGVGGVFMSSAYSAASTRDEAYSALMAGASSADYNGLRQQVIDEQDSAASAQTLGVSALVGAGLFAVWTAIEWMSGPPEVGEIMGEGVTPVAAEAAP